MKAPYRARLAIALVAAGILSPLVAARGQRGLDRALSGIRGGGRDTVTEAHRSAGTFSLLPLASEDTVPKKARLLLQPLGSFNGSDNDAGVLVGYKNTNRFSNVPWLIDARAVRRYRDRVAHPRWQADAEVDPVMPAKIPLLIELTGSAARTTSVARSEELAAEVDWDLLHDGTLTIGPIAYYDWNSPTGATTSSGGTVGFVGYIERGRVNLTPEYDLSSSFNGGTSYSVVASVLLYTTSRDTQIRVRGGWEKGNTFSARLQIGIPNNRESNAAKRLR